MVVRSSYLHNGISYTGKMASLYWISPLIPFLWHFETWTTWLPICRQHIQIHFLVWKLLHFDSKFYWNALPMVQKQWVSICSDNGLVPYQRLAIIWTSDGPVYSCIFVSLGLDGLNLHQRDGLWMGCFPETCPHLLLGFVRTRVLMSRSRLNNGATHGGWHFDIHRDFDTRGR